MSVENVVKKKWYASVWLVPKLTVTYKMCSYHGVLLSVKFRLSTNIELKKAINLCSMLEQVDFSRVTWVALVTIHFRNEFKALLTT